MASHKTCIIFDQKHKQCYPTFPNAIPAKVLKLWMSCSIHDIEWYLANMRLCRASSSEGSHTARSIYRPSSLNHDPLTESKIHLPQSFQTASNLQEKHKNNSSNALEFLSTLSFILSVYALWTIKIQSHIRYPYFILMLKSFFWQKIDATINKLAPRTFVSRFTFIKPVLALIYFLLVYFLNSKNWIKYLPGKRNRKTKRKNPRSTNKFLDKIGYRKSKVENQNSFRDSDPVYFFLPKHIVKYWWHFTNICVEVLSLGHGSMIRGSCGFSHGMWAGGKAFHGMAENIKSRGRGDISRKRRCHQRINHCHRRLDRAHRQTCFCMHSQQTKATRLIKCFSDNTPWTAHELSHKVQNLQ